MIAYDYRAMAQQLPTSNKLQDVRQFEEAEQIEDVPFAIRNMRIVQNMKKQDVFRFIIIEEIFSIRMLEIINKKMAHRSLGADEYGKNLLHRRNQQNIYT